MKPAFKILTLILASFITQSGVLPSFAQEIERRETSLLTQKPLNATTYESYNEEIPFKGRIYDKAIVQNIDIDGGISTYANREKFDLFEADVVPDTDGNADQLQFFVLGDGEVLFKTFRLTRNDAPVHISVPIAKYKAISLSVKGFNLGGLPRAIWGEPKLVRLVQVQPHPATATPTVTDLPEDTPAEEVGDIVTLGHANDGRYTISVNGIPVRFTNVTPQMKSGRLLVPMRPLFEALGAKVSYNAADQTIKATRNGQEIKMQVDSVDAFVNGSSSPLDVPAQSMFGTTLVPLRFVVESFKAKLKNAN